MARGCRLAPAAAVQPSRRAAPLPRAPRGGRPRPAEPWSESRPLDWRGTAAVPLDVARRPSTRAHVDSWVDPPATAPSARRRAVDTRACGLGRGGREGRRGKIRDSAAGRLFLPPACRRGAPHAARPEPAEAPVGVPVLSRGVPACRPLPAAQGGQEAPAVPLPMRRMIRAPNPDGRVRLCIPSRA